MTKPMGAVNKNTIKQLRTRYAAIWNHEWPHEDEYLKTLWRRAVAEVKMDHAGFDKERYNVTLNAMRENHVLPGEELVTAGSTCQPLQDHMNNSFR